MFRAMQTNSIMLALTLAASAVAGCAEDPADLGADEAALTGTGVTASTIDATVAVRGNLPFFPLRSGTLIRGDLVLTTSNDPVTWITDPTHGGYVQTVATINDTAPKYAVTGVRLNYWVRLAVLHLSCSIPDTVAHPARLSRTHRGLFNADEVTFVGYGASASGPEGVRRQFTTSATRLPTSLGFEYTGPQQIRDADSGGSVYISEYGERSLAGVIQGPLGHTGNIWGTVTTGAVIEPFGSSYHTVYILPWIMEQMAAFPVSPPCPPVHGDDGPIDPPA